MVATVYDLCQYRARRSHVRPDRLALGTQVRFDDIIEGQVVAAVVGTWAFTGIGGMPGTVRTRDQRFQADPKSDETAVGYLLRPIEGTGFIYAHFGDVATGDLVAI